MRFIEWMFGSVWRFFGMLILFGVFLEGTADIILASEVRAQTDCSAAVNQTEPIFDGEAQELKSS